MNRGLWPLCGLPRLAVYLCCVSLFPLCPIFLSVYLMKATKSVPQNQKERKKDSGLGTWSHQFLYIYGLFLKGEISKSLQCVFYSPPALKLLQNWCCCTAVVLWALTLDFSLCPVVTGTRTNKVLIFLKKMFCNVFLLLFFIIICFCFVFFNQCLLRITYPEDVVLPCFLITVCWILSFAPLVEWTLQLVQSHPLMSLGEAVDLLAYVFMFSIDSI